MKQKTLETLGIKTRKKGFIILSICLLFLTSLLSYSPTDACWNVVSDIKTKNLLGSFGANISDLLFQYFGFSIFVPFPFFIFLSIKYIQKQPIKFVVFKAIYTLILTLCFAFLLCSIAKMQFLFVVPLGGKVGFIINKLISSIILKIVFVFLSILLLFIYPYSVFFFGKKTKKQVYKDNKGKRFSIAIILFGIIKRGEELGKIFYYFLRYPFTSIKVISTRAIKKAKSIFVKKSKQDNKEENKIENDKSSNTNMLKEVVDEYEYTPPSVSLLRLFETNVGQNKIVCEENIAKLTSILGDFGVRGEIMGFRTGPVVTLYEFKPQAGIKASRVIGLSDDIARMMMVSSVRIATISGRDTLGIEVPNKERGIVCFRKLVESDEYNKTKSLIPMIFGCNIFGKPIVADLTTMPHLLIAGTTGSGKSVGINGMILSMLYSLSPKQCRFIMIDPKMLEFSSYEGIPHLLMPVVTDAKKAVLALKWVVKEMETRYKMMSEAGVRNIGGYNQKADRCVKNGNDYENDIELKPMPYIVVVIDEMADLMVVAGKEIEVLVQRLSQMARAAGIHLIMATQRPSVDVITGVIKSNFPTRISYAVTSKIDSRTILGEQGAEQLLGKGDLLFTLGGSKMLRVHGPLITDDEVENVVSYLKKYNDSPEYVELIDEDDEESSGDEDNDFEKSGEDLYQQAINVVLKDKKTSISYLQRRLRIGYNKAANFIEQMEEDGILSSPDMSGKRMILRENN